MDRDYFWLDEEQFSRLEPVLPSDTRGVPRAVDRRVISGIIHVWNIIPIPSRWNSEVTSALGQSRS